VRLAFKAAAAGHGPPHKAGVVLVAGAVAAELLLVGAGELDVDGLRDGDGGGDLVTDFDGDGDGDADGDADLVGLLLGVGEALADGLADTGSADGLTDGTYTIGAARAECVAEGRGFALADGCGVVAAALGWPWACATGVTAGLVKARTATAETTTRPPVT
jgi:hypothetical protein